MPPRIVPGAALAAALMLAACRSDRPADTRVAGADSAQPASGSGGTPAPAITVTASDYAFDAPASVPAGLITVNLVNRGPSVHHVQLLRLEEGKTAADFTAALKAGGPPRWAVPAGGPNPPEVGETATAQLALEPGQYVMVCFVPALDGTPHLMRGMMRPLTVTAASGPAGPEPAADVVMKLVDFDFQLSRPLTAGRHLLRIENAAGQPHEVAIVRLEPGKDPLSVAAWGEHPEGPAPGKFYGGVSAIMPGTYAFVPVDLPAGDYGLLCFLPEMKDGKPHFAHGMAKRVKVS